MTIVNDMLQSAKSGRLKAGKSDLIKHLHGIRITQRQAIRAKCYDCNGMGDQDDCDIETCSLYPFSPYRNDKGVAKVVSGSQKPRIASTSTPRE